MDSGDRCPHPQRGRIARTLTFIGLLVLSACGGSAPTVAPATGATAVMPTLVGATATAGVVQAPAAGSATSGTPSSGTTATRAAAPASRPTGTASPAATATRNPFGLAPGVGSAVDGMQLTGPIKLTFWHAQPPGVRDQELQRLISGFQAQYPNITITSEYQGSTLFNKVRAAATAGWAAATGYLPVRQSALQAPAMVSQLAAQPAYRVAAIVLPPTARPEPAIRGTTETRKFIEDALFIAITDPRRIPCELLDDAVRQANAASAQQR